jgi:uncharacterized protein YabN with tetrapyrrole methylase and pyrophosphatase domain
LKQDERGDTSVLDHVPRTMPALMQAQSLQSRASKAGLDGGGADAGRLAAAVEALGSSDVTADVLGDALFAIVAFARTRGFDAEDALRGAIERFRISAGTEEASAKQP